MFKINWQIPLSAGCYFKRAHILINIYSRKIKSKRVKPSSDYCIVGCRKIAVPWLIFCTRVWYIKPDLNYFIIRSKNNFTYRSYPGMHAKVHEPADVFRMYFHIMALWSTTNRTTRSTQCIFIQRRNFFVQAADPLSAKSGLDTNKTITI